MYCKHCGNEESACVCPASPAKKNNLIATGYVCMVVSLLIVPPAFGIAAFICGVLNLSRGEKEHGVAQIVGSIVCAIAGMVLGTALSSL